MSKITILTTAFITVLTAMKALFGKKYKRMYSAKSNTTITKVNF